MNRSAQRRADSPISRNGRIIAVVTILVVGAIIAVTKVSNAADQRRAGGGGIRRAVGQSGQCQPAPGPAAPNGQSTTVSQQNGRTVRNHWSDGQDCSEGATGGAGQQNVKGQKRGQAQNGQGQNGQAQGGGAAAVECPSAAQKIKKVPAGSREAVVSELATMQKQIAAVDQRLAAGQNADKLMAQLTKARGNSLKRIAAAMQKAGGKAPADLEAAAVCTLKKNDGAQQNGNAGNNAGQNNNGQQNNGQQNNNNQNNNGQQNGNNNQNNNNQNNNNGGKNNGGQINDPNNLGVLGTQCEGTSKLAPHTGFQDGNRCVALEMGEVGSENKNPSLLITKSPQQVGVNQPFQLEVSTKNLIRDRFLAAAKGGYYAEMSLLNNQGLVRGHFHTACRMLDSLDAAPDAAPAPAFFVATEDGGGSAKADKIVIEVPGLPAAGTAQCASWAGDGSHRIPMMQRANQTPAFDAVRVEVGGGGNNNNQNNNQNNQNNNNQNAGQQGQNNNQNQNNAGQQAGQQGQQQQGGKKKKNNNN